MVRDYIEFPNKQRMPLVGLGTWQADNEQETIDAVHTALDAGYRHFDTATLYQNEASLGKAFKQYIDAGKIKRGDLFIVTKLPWNAMHPERVNRFLKASLKRLQVDYLDLYLCHWPLGTIHTTDEDLAPQKDGKFIMDPTTNIEQVWKAMEEQVDAGLTKSIGLSNYTVPQVERIMKIARIAPANHQMEIQAYFQNREWTQVAKKYNMTICAYGPLGSPGRRSYSFNGVSYHVPSLMEDPTVVEIAKRHNKTAAQVLLRFLVQQDFAVIPKSTNAQRLGQNIEIFDFTLTEDEMKQLLALEKGEDGRSFPALPGFADHPECPFPELPEKYKN